MDRKSEAVAQTLVRTNFNLAANVGLHLAAQIALNLVVTLNEGTKLYEVVLGGVLHAQVRANASLF